MLVERADPPLARPSTPPASWDKLRGSLSLTRMMMDSVDLYRTLADEVDLETG